MTDQKWIIDTEPSTKYPVYTRLNANDVMPDPITPLGGSLVWIPEVMPGWGKGYIQLDAFTPAEIAAEAVAPVGGFIYGHLYINQTTVRIIGIRAGIGADAIDAAFFAHPGAPKHEPSDSDVNEELSARMAGRTQWALTATTFPEIDEEREYVLRLRSARPNLAAATNEILVSWARSAACVQRLMWGRGYCMASNQTAVGPGVIAALVGAVDPTLVVRLIGSAGDVDSALPSYALWDLSRIVRGDDGLTATFDAGMEGLLGRLHSEHPDFATRFDNFVYEYGYRGPSEWDPGVDSWETKPELPLGLIDRLRQLEDSASPALRREEHATEAAEALQQALGILGDNEEAVQTLQLAIGSARRFAAWRERGKTTAVMAMNEVRAPLFELGRRLVAKGELDHPRQVFMALNSELDALTTHAGELRDILRERERQWKELFEVELPTFVVATDGVKPVSELNRKGSAQVAAVRPGDVLAGAPASAGVARGRARVIRDLSQIADFEPGEILVAPQTDPSWTPLFMVASGVVVDVGAMGSHAMIVSRELGIPCAAGVENASSRIPDGTLLEVDGSSGKVTVLEG
ncbi:MAG TPA: PEP-utilizing enzyme [Jatrophihabitans sp.]|nr:PEP-utilizing enzyme [Jatrophihabitans sp.]